MKKKYKIFSGQKTFFGEQKRLEKLEKLGDKLLKLKDEINWKVFRPILERHIYQVNASGGRPPYDYIIMIKIMVLQRYYNISDHEMEYQLNDRLSFQRFLNIGIDDDIPDETTIALFREKLIEYNLMKKLFRIFLKELKNKNMIGNKVRMVDASFVEAPKQRNTREENKQIKNGETPDGWNNNPHKVSQKDIEARWTKKNNEVHFGFKNHIKADGKSKLVLEYAVTPANVHDSQVIIELIKTDDKKTSLYADSAYKSEDIDKRLLEMDIKNKIVEKAYRNKPLTKKQIAANKKKSSTRVRVEHIFGYIENSMNGSVLRCIGELRAELNVGITNFTYNIFRSLQIA